MIREAFFPTGAQEYAVEPAQPKDQAAIIEIISGHEGPTMRRSLIQWWSRTPQAFFVTRDRKAVVQGFYCVLDAGLTRVHGDDPVVRTWLDHLDQQPLSRQQSALFFRRWLGADTGEQPAAVQAACWIDLKRTYLELRPHLRRVYLTVRDLRPYAAVAQTLGFQVLLDRSIQADGDTYSTAMLDFGPSSVDGWLARLVAAELGIEDDGLLDSAARELVLNGRRVSLTKLEFGVMEYLQMHAGKAVSRVSLLENVWQQRYDGGSNVVDVVVRSLRKKLAGRASMIETVQGVGYRLRLEQ